LSAVFSSVSDLGIASAFCTGRAGAAVADGLNKSKISICDVAAAGDSAIVAEVVTGNKAGIMVGTSDEGLDVDEDGDGVFKVDGTPVEETLWMLMFPISNFGHAFAGRRSGTGIKLGGEETGMELGGEVGEMVM
jgi:hypothetical protein